MTRTWEAVWGTERLLGFIAFGYPGFMYAVFGRFTWRSEVEREDELDEWPDSEGTQREWDEDGSNAGDVGDGEAPR
ncbi:MAG: hypothetical protein ACYC35_13845 [Pirellulales bacterium]